MSGVPEAAVIAKLKATGAVTAIVGQRIYPRIATQQVPYPYLVVLRPPGQMNGHVCGPAGGGPIGVARTPIVVACVGDTYEKSRLPAEAVSDALDQSGWTGSQFWNGTEIASCFQDDEFDQSTLAALADEIGFPCEFIAFTLEHAK